MMVFHRVGVAADHAGKDLKDAVLSWLRTQVPALSVTDFGTNTSGRVDYPDFAASLAGAISAGQLDGGIAICGTGIGMCIAANKHPGVRAASAWDEYSCKMGREHNDANVLCLGARTTPKDLALTLVSTWLTTPFAGGHHVQRLQKIAQLDKRYFHPTKESSL